MARVRVVMVPGWQRRVQAHADPALFRIAHEIADDARGNIRSNDNIETGAMYRSVHARKHGLAWRVWIGTRHWHFVEYGTRPHLIRPRRAPALSFVIDGRRINTQLVRHPGNRAYSNVRRAFYKRRPLGR